MTPRVPRSRVTHDRWLVSYADFITLLFGFFVVLYAFAKADQKKQVQVSQAINSAFRSMGVFPLAVQYPSTSSAAGAEQAIQPTNAVMSEDLLTPAQVKDDLDRLRRELTQTLSNQVANHSISLEMGRDGLVISLREAGFFDSGSAVAQAAGPAHAAPDCRQAGRHCLTICASKATPTMCPSTTPSSTPTGSSPRPGPRASRGSSWT